MTGSNRLSVHAVITAASGGRVLVRIFLPPPVPSSSRALIHLPRDMLLHVCALLCPRAMALLMRASLLLGCERTREVQHGAALAALHARLPKGLTLPGGCALFNLQLVLQSHLIGACGGEELAEAAALLQAGASPEYSPMQWMAVPSTCCPDRRPSDHQCDLR